MGDGHWRAHDEYGHSLLIVGVMNLARVHEGILLAWLACDCSVVCRSHRPRLLEVV